MSQNPKLPRNQSGRPGVVWLTGLSGAGKSTIAEHMRATASAQGINLVVLDGDDLRGGLNSDLGFSVEDRSENLRRVAHVAKLLRENDCLVIVATISPEQKHRDNARAIVGDDFFIEVFVDTPLEVCEARDVKGLYTRARRNEIDNFTGVQARYEHPLRADLHIRPELSTPEECVEFIFDCVRKKFSSLSNRDFSRR